MLAYWVTVAFLVVRANALCQPLEVKLRGERSAHTTASTLCLHHAIIAQIMPGYDCDMNMLYLCLPVFIPAPIVAHPTTPAGNLIRGVTRAFAGDGRGFSYDSGTSRAELTVQVPVKEPSGAATLDTANFQQVAKFGTSHEHDASECFTCLWNIQHPAGRPGWWWEPVASHPPKIKGTATLQQSSDNLRADVQQAGSSKAEVTLLVAAGNPLVTGAPDIDAKLTVTLELRTDGSSQPAKQVFWRAGMQGAHDGFPSYEVYVNGNRLYGYMAGFGASPNNLFPPMDVRISPQTTLWQSLCTAERREPGAYLDCCAPNHLSHGPYSGKACMHQQLPSGRHHAGRHALLGSNRVESNLRLKGRLSKCVLCYSSSFAWTPHLQFCHKFMPLFARAVHQGCHQSGSVETASRRAGK